VKNLEQIRAKHALNFWHPAQGQPPSARGVNDGDVISKLPSLVVANGLLATTAFAKSKGGGHDELMTAVFRFLCHADRALLPQPPQPRPGETQLDTFIRLLTDGDDATSTRLQLATAEALAYLGYLKRFAP
jgi:CRISPR/Cas system CMR-associated protein Cmr5 small subunit